VAYEYPNRARMPTAAIPATRNSSFVGTCFLGLPITLPFKSHYRLRVDLRYSATEFLHLPFESEVQIEGRCALPEKPVVDLTQHQSFLDFLYVIDKAPQ